MFERYIVNRKIKGRQHAYWFLFLKTIQWVPGLTRAEVSRLWNPKWERYSTNVWADLIRYGYLRKEREGVTFKYYITEKGILKLAKCDLKENLRNFKEKV